jgi:alpha-N-acetylglucosamine transferase
VYLAGGDIKSETPERTERRLVVTLAIDDAMADLAVLTLPGQRAYAQRLNAEHRILTQPRIGAGSPYYEIFRLYELLGDYDRVLYLDLDVLVRTDTPNLFDQVPPGFLGAFFESRLVDRSEPIRQIQDLWSITTM